MPLDPYRLIRPLAFQFDSETIHRATMSAVDFFMSADWLHRWVRGHFHVSRPELRQTLWGIPFSNPVGLAAGFDKNAEYIRALTAFGFGSIEVGTVTGLPQEGTPRPRLFRLPDDEALLNRMGFNNHGREVVARRLTGVSPSVPLGINIGKSKAVALDEAVGDYEASFGQLYEHGDYFVVNVSSPNTPGLRDLQNYEPLSELLGRLQEMNRALRRRRTERGEPSDDGRAAGKPLLVKIAPDLDDDELRAVLQVVDERDVDGIIATNTTTRRDNLETAGQRELGPGGISGRPLANRSRELIATIYRETDGEVPIIGVGGIFEADDALAAIRAGASLLQVWTGFVYEGPAMVRRINRGLVEACETHDWTSIQEAVGDRHS